MKTVGLNSSSSLALVLLWTVLCLCLTVSDGYVKYNTGAGVVPGKLNVHLVAHSHDDVGWLKTVDQYYIGLDKHTQDACVENVLDSVIAALLRDPNRRFVFAEMAFFHLWWVEQNPEMQELVRKLVDAGQLEFVNGGWCMHDEAAAHYIDMIDQTTLGHGLIKRLFNTTPRAGWQIDPFGHSAVQAYLLGVEVGFDSVHFARIDYQDREVRKKQKSLEVIWRGSKTFGSSSQIFTNVFPTHYSPPEGFHFELTDYFTHLQDNPLLEAYNVEQRVEDFISAALSQAKVTRDNHIMWTMGDDFQYQYAESWFKQMDKLIHHVNKDGRVNALYSTPSIYTDAKNAGNTSWPLKTGDYFPYADRENAYWTGYFSSRPGLKGYIRMLSGYYLAARQLEFLAGKTSKVPAATYVLGDALGIAQHHDAVSGTAKQHTTDDYAKRLAIGANKAEAVVNSALSCLTDKSGDQCATTTSTFSQCPLLNISYCPPTEEDMSEGKNLVIVAYNPLGWSRTDVIRIPVIDSNLVVQDSSGITVDAQYVHLDNATKNVRQFYTEAYLGHSPKIVPQYWLVFQVTVPPLGWNTYFISKAAGIGEKLYRILSTIELPKNENIEVGPGNLKMSFSSATGQLQRIYNYRTGVDIPVRQKFLYYNSYEGYDDSSGAYLFRPDSLPTNVPQSKPMEVIRGALVDEVHQQFDTWINQVTRLYKEKEHAEVEYTIGPIPGEDYYGKEVISRITTDLTTEKVFYTDSNGRDFLKRIRDHRADWNYQVNQPEAGNYYPLNLGMFITDKKSEFSILVDRATGGSSLKDGEVEIMLHRRMFYDDGRGVGEALNEKVCVKDTCQALTVRGKYYLSIDKQGDGAHWRRTTGQEVYSPLLLAFTYENSETWKSGHTTKATTMDPNYTLPLNVALITLQVLDDGSVLVRLAHLYEAGEDSEYSTLAKVELKKIFYGKLYNTGAGVVPGKLNVHLVAHSHDDVGWLETVDQYYIGSGKYTQGACVENVLDSVIAALLRDPNRRFVFAEMAFFYRWWAEQNPEMQELVRKLVYAGQLEFVNGGWCMHDEAATHYIDMIDQTTLGHGLIKHLFNTTPRAGWQIDPFGHSAVQAYLLGAEVGFDSIHFARIDYQDREERKKHKSLEVIWRGSKTFGSSSQIFANVFPNHYGPPDGFRFELSDNFSHLQDNPLLEAYNVEQRVDDFIKAALSQAEVTRDNHIMWTMGGDFEYQYAESWFKQMDKLIHYVNKDGRVNALYSTPSIYTDAKNAGNTSWPLKTDDYFPYADRENAYWTGYFTSRPSLKGFIRMLSGYYLTARQLEFLSGKRSKGPTATYILGDALGIAQHHDAVTGTAKQHATDDYAKRLAIGARKVEAVVSSTLSCLTDKSGDQCATTTSTFSQCSLLNISYCPPTEENISKGKDLVIVAYNPLGWSRTDFIRIPVVDSNLVVQDSSGNTVRAQYVHLDNVTKNVRQFYTEAYLGHLPKIVPHYWLVFQVTVPPLGWNTYFISKAAGTVKRQHKILSTINHPKKENIEVGPGNLKMSFSSTTGQLQRMYNSRTGVDVSVQQNFLYYNSYEGYDSSGAYLFRPNGPPIDISQSKPVEVIRGTLVDEVHQQFDTWINQITRLYKYKEHAEVEYTIGPIPGDYYGKEVISRITTNLTTEKFFYTDSNGRDFLKRIRDYRADWNYQINQPEAGNYYPLNLGMFIKDKKSEFSILVDRATGGSSLKDGEVEIMLHRRMFYDDGRGVDEALNEEVWVNDTHQSLTVRGKYYLSINKLGDGARWRRKTGQEVYSPLLLAFTYENSETWKANHTTKATTMDPNYTLPLNVALITLQVLDDGSVLVRLAHLYEAGEDPEYSILAKVELKKIFYGESIKKVMEMSLSANQQKSEMKRLDWKVEGDNGPKRGPVKGGPVDESTLVVELGPMEIRTFLLKF